MQKLKRRISDEKAYSISDRFFFMLTDIKTTVIENKMSVDLLMLLSYLQLFSILFEDIIIFDFESALKYSIAILKLDIATMFKESLIISYVLFSLSLIYFFLIMIQIFNPKKRRFILINRIIAFYYFASFTILPFIAISSLEYIIVEDYIEQGIQSSQIIIRIIPVVLNILICLVSCLVFTYFLFRDNFRLGNCLINQTQGWAYFYFLNKTILYIIHILANIDSVTKVIYGLCLGTALIIYLLQIMIYYNNAYNKKTSYKITLLKMNVLIEYILLAKIFVIIGWLSNEILYFLITVFFNSLGTYIIFTFRANTFYSRSTSIIDFSTKIKLDSFLHLIDSLLFGIVNKNENKYFKQYLEYINQSIELASKNKVNGHIDDKNTIFLNIINYIEHNYIKEYHFDVLYMLMNIKLETEKINYKMVTELLNILENVNNIKETYLITEAVRELQQNIRRHTTEAQKTLEFCEINVIKYASEITELRLYLLEYVNIEVKFIESLAKSDKVFNSSDIIFGKFIR